MSILSPITGLVNILHPIPRNVISCLMKGKLVISFCAFEGIRIPVNKTLVSRGVWIGRNFKKLPGNYQGTEIRYNTSIFSDSTTQRHWPWVCSAAKDELH